MFRFTLLLKQKISNLVAERLRIIPIQLSSKEKSLSHVGNAFSINSCK